MIEKLAIDSCMRIAKTPSKLAPGCINIHVVYFCPRCAGAIAPPLEASVRQCYHCGLYMIAQAEYLYISDEEFPAMSTSTRDCTDAHCDAILNDIHSYGNSY